MLSNSLTILVHRQFLCVLIHLISFIYVRLFHRTKNSVFQQSTLHIFYFSASNEFREMLIERAYFHEVYNFHGLENLLKKKFFYAKKITASFLYNKGNQRVPNKK